MLFERQRLLLALLDAFGGVVAHTDFQKLLFLYTHECETEPSYEFVLTLCLEIEPAEGLVWA